MEISTTSVGNVLTRTSGYLRTITSHSLQPYRGCPLGNSLCGVGCYVQHNPYVTQGRRWGSFLEVRTNAADSYRATAAREARWARRHRREFSIFLSSSTEPFPPQEKRYGITRQILEAMAEQRADGLPDELVVQTHSPRVTEVADVLGRLANRCRLRVHISIETDRPKLPGLPPPASTIAQRFAAANQLKAAGLCTVITVAPLLPLEDPEAFFSQVAQAADAVVLDHFIGGDGSSTGSRTRRTALPAAMEEVQPGSSELEYRDAMVRIAQRYLPGRVGVGIDGFAGRFLP